MGLPLFALALAATVPVALWLPDRESGQVAGDYDASSAKNSGDVVFPLNYLSPEFLTVPDQRLNSTFEWLQLDQIATDFNDFGLVGTAIEFPAQRYPTCTSSKDHLTSFFPCSRIPTGKVRVGRELYSMIDYDALIKRRPKYLRPVSRKRLRRALTNTYRDIEDFTQLCFKCEEMYSCKSCRQETLRALNACIEIAILWHLINMCLRLTLDNPDALHFLVIILICDYLKVPKSVAMLVACSCLLPLNAAVKDEDGGSSGNRCPVFEGITANFVSWLISFTAWVAWKAPELVPILNGTLPLPTPVNPANITPLEKAKIKKWKLHNTQLYGAIVSHVAAPIQASLHVQSNGDGLSAVTYLKQRYGSQSTGDRAEATARLQRSYIDPRAKLSEGDIIKQYNEMSLAAADIIAAGGNRPDDELLISMFENSLPVTYAMIRQMVRYSKHTRFEDYYNDFLSQVKAEERAANLSATPAAFSASHRVDYNKGGRGKGHGKGGGGRSAGRGNQQYSPCFNCGRSDHLRQRCPQGWRTLCKYCGANHIDELCPRGPGGSLRDSLTDTAKLLLDKQANFRPPTGNNSESSNHQAYSTTNQQSYRNDWLETEYQAFLSRKRPAPSNCEYPATKEQRTSSTNMHASGQNVPGASRATPSQPSNSNSSNAHIASSSRTSDFHELDEFFDSIKPHAHFVEYEKAYACAVHAKHLHHIAFIDSQATNFVVPSSDYLMKITDSSPKAMVDTANGSVRPTCIGDTTIQMFDDQGTWHSFDIRGVWVLPGCDRILYSQAAMSKLGVIHRLDEGYVLLPTGSKKSISVQSYSMEISFPLRSVHAASTISIPLPRNIARSEIGTSVGDRASVPQQLVWQRLGFPSKQIWLRIMDVTKDHGLPSNAHLKHDFPMLEAVARARARAKSFNDLRDSDHLPAPGAVVYMDFAGPMIPSYPHGYTYYCGAVDAGSGYARSLPSHSPTREVAQRCLELLLADLRLLMGLSHKLRPQVLVSDQGTQFMSHYFRDFLSSEQIRHLPATVYTPQQNSIVERMWGTRFGMTRALLKFANLGPCMHPFGMQCANWICNRLPQSSRANLSPWFILSRMPASIGYLKSFGCLVRMTIPEERRVGDKHFADRGVLGIYLGPSEQSPGCVVYVPSMRKFFVTRDVICYEDVHPGIKHIDSHWSDIDEGATGTPLMHDIDTPYLNVSESMPNDAMPLSTTTHESTDHPIPTGQGVEDSAESDIQTATPYEAISSEHSDPTRPELEETRVPSSPAADAMTPNPALDPRSRQYIRVLPDRSTRYKGAYRCAFVDPCNANEDQAIHNILILKGDELRARCDLVAYESCVACMHRACIVTTTSELGQVQIPRGYHHSQRVPEASYWKEAILKEYKGLLEIGTFEFIKRSDVPAHANIMRCHLVFALKRNQDGSIDKFKARLVADGNTQRYGVDFDRIFSTVAKLSTLRIILVLTAAYDYNASSIDIRQAYLQATLNEELFMEIPPGLPNVNADGEPLVARLKRSLYGLKQAGREWHLLLTGTLKEFGFVQSTIDVCLFNYTRLQSILIIVVWVDDCVILDNDVSLRSEFVTWLSQKFPVEDKGDLKWILHVEISRDRPQYCLCLSQELYIRDLLGKYEYLLDGLTRRFDSPHDATVTLTPEQCPSLDSPEYSHMERHREDYMSLVGAYLWLSNVTRPDLTFIAGQLARFVNNPGMVHYKAALRVLVYLRASSSQTLTFQPKKDRQLRAFVDADWAVKFSVSGGMLEFMGCLIHWLSRTQRSVSMSSTEAEYFATCVLAREVVYFRELLADLRHLQSGPTTILTDNKGVVALSFDPVAFKKTKHILRAAEYVRDLATRQVISLRWVTAKNNVADLCTKSVVLVVFRALMSLLTRLSDVS